MVTGVPNGDHHHGGRAKKYKLFTQKADQYTILSAEKTIIPGGPMVLSCLRGLGPIRTLVLSLQADNCRPAPAF